jgi:hypothetical protein
MISVRDVGPISICPDPEGARTQAEWNQRLIDSVNKRNQPIQKEISDIESRLQSLVRSQSHDGNIYFIVGVYTFLVVLNAALIIAFKKRFDLGIISISTLMFWIVVMIIHGYMRSNVLIHTVMNDKKEKSLEDELRILRIRLSPHPNLGQKFTVKLCINSSEHLQIICDKLEEAYETRARIHAAAQNIDRVAHHIDNSTNISIGGNVNVSINSKLIDGELKKLLSRIEIERLENRRELKSYFDEIVRAISNNDANLAVTKLDRFCDRYKKVVGAVNETLQLANNIRRLLLGLA